MGGWLFSEAEMGAKRPSAIDRSKDTLEKLGCQACPLNHAKGLKSPKMVATGSEKPLIYVLGEGPGKEEDKQGRQFVGRTGQLLRGYLPGSIIPKIRWNNVINCRPEGNRTPTQVEISCCRSRIVTDIEATKPKAIFGFGNVPLQWAINEQKITTWRGMRIPVQIGKHYCYYYPFHHPSYLSRMQQRHPVSGKSLPSEFEKFFERDLKRAIREVKKLPDATVVSGKEITDGVEVITSEKGWGDVKRIRERLKAFGKLDTVAFDYETASNETVKERQLRPYGKGSRLLTIAVGTEEDVIAFPIMHREAQWSNKQREAVLEIWTEFLRSPAEKIAHNLFFELEWTSVLIGRDLIRSCTWHDTMAQAYVLSRPRGTTSLDALILTGFGFRLKQVSSVNLSNLDNEPLERVLLYNGLDAKWTHALFGLQRDELKYHKLWWLYEDQVRRIPTVVLKSYFGMLIDYDAVISFDKDYSPQIAKLEKWFASCREATKFKKRMKRDFKPSSPRDVQLMLTNVLGRKECRVGEDEKGKPKYSTEDKVLEQIPLEIAKKIRQYRAVRGNKSKYVDPLLPEGHKPMVTINQSSTGKYVWPDGLTHASLKTLFLVTRRTSCEFPNEQFWPKRDENYNDLRKLFVAPTRDVVKHINTGFEYTLPSHISEDDCYFVTIDYGQIQARIAGMVSRDPIFCKYLWDRNDIHMRWTKELARAYPKRIGGRKFLKDQDVLKRFRTDVKNQWTFPLIFGATAPSVAGYLGMPVEIIKPLRNQFFREMPGLAKWQRKTRKFYDEHGYVETPNGWRRYGPLDHGEVINTPIQSAEADIVIDAMNRLSEAAQELDLWQFQARLEIHDELAFWIPKKTIDRDLEFIANEMLKCDHYDWICVPLCIEIGKGPNWYAQKEVSVIYSDDLGLLDRETCGF